MLNQPDLTEQQWPFSCPSIGELGWQEISDPMDFLLIQESQDHFWQNVIREALVTIGQLQVVGEDASISRIVSGSYDLVIVDASSVENGALLVARIRAQMPRLRVIVASIAPSWREVREMFHAGAIDCIDKSFDKIELLTAVRSALATDIGKKKQMEM